MGRLTAPVELTQQGETIKIVAGGKGYNVANLDINNFSVKRSGNLGNFFVLTEDNEDFGFAFEDVTIPAAINAQALMDIIVGWKT